MRPRDELPDAATWGQLNSLLARQGYSQPQRSDAIGSRNENQTNEELSFRLTSWLRIAGVVRVR